MNHRFSLNLLLFLKKLATAGSWVFPAIGIWEYLFRPISSSEQHMFFYLLVTAQFMVLTSYTQRTIRWLGEFEGRGEKSKEIYRGKNRKRTLLFPFTLLLAGMFVHHCQVPPFILAALLPAAIEFYVLRLIREGPVGA